MQVLVFLTVFGLFILVTVLYIVYNIIEKYVRLLFGYKLYKFTRIPSYGSLITIKRWYKNDEQALKRREYFDFIEMISPQYKKIKPTK